MDDHCLNNYSPPLGEGVGGIAVNLGAELEILRLEKVSRPSKATLYSHFIFQFNFKPANQFSNLL